MGFLVGRALDAVLQGVRSVSRGSRGPNGVRRTCGGRPSATLSLKASNGGAREGGERDVLYGTGPPIGRRANVSRLRTHANSARGKVPTYGVEAEPVFRGRRPASAVIDADGVRASDVFIIQEITVNCG